MLSPVIVGSVIIAVVGWFATIIAINNSQFSHKRLLFVPAWFPWIALALGAPILNGFVSLGSALNIGGAVTVGMLVSVVASRRQRR